MRVCTWQRRFFLLSHNCHSNEWNLIIPIKRNEADKILKRVHYPFRQIRQVARRRIKEEEEKIVVCRYVGRLFSFFYSLFFSFKFLFFVICQNRIVDRGRVQDNRMIYDMSLTVTSQRTSSSYFWKRKSKSEYSRWHWNRVRHLMFFFNHLKFLPISCTNINES